MAKENGPRKGSRWIRVDGAVRLIDTPNSRMGLEVDLSLLPWDPFDALGKKVTVLVPSPELPDNPHSRETDDLEEAIRFVGHAADRCKEFAEAGDGDTSDWWKAYRTWDWLRDHLQSEWEGEEGEGPALEPEAKEEAEDLPSLPGAASILEYTLGALRTIPLQHWEETVATLDPEAPSREEAIRTMQILSRLLRRPAGEDPGDSPSPAQEPMGQESEAADPEASLGEAASAPGSKDAPVSDPEARGDPDSIQHAEEPHGDEMSFEYANGFDEGYRKGRRVGFALGNHARKRGRRVSDGS